MAQTTDSGSRTRGSASAGNGASGSNGSNGSTGTSGSGDGGVRRGFSLSSLGSSLSGLLGPRQAGGANGATGTSAQQRPSTGMGGFLKGWLMLVVGMYVLQIALYLVDVNLFHGWLETHYIAGSHGGTKPGSAFLLGGTTWYLLIFIALFAGLYYLLVRLKILPKDLFGSRSQANARAAREVHDTSRATRNGTTAAAPKAAPLPSGVNPYADRTRAARREAQRRAAAAVTAPQPKRGLFGRSKPAAAPATPAASGATKKPASNPEPVQTGAARPADTHYQRVRAEQRQRKRRAAKR